jgi:hypothetical protein
MTKTDFEYLDPNLVDEVEKIRIVLGGDPTTRISFVKGNDEGLVFDFTGTRDEIQKYAEHNETPLICLQAREIGVPRTTSADWLVGAVALSKKGINFYLTNEVCPATRLFECTLPIVDAILSFAVQVAGDVNYTLEFRDDTDDAIAVCIYPIDPPLSTTLLN